MVLGRQATAFDVSSYNECSSYGSALPNVRPIEATLPWQSLQFRKLGSPASTKREVARVVRQDPSPSMPEALTDACASPSRWVSGAATISPQTGVGMLIGCVCELPPPVHVSVNPGRSLDPKRLNDGQRTMTATRGCEPW